LQIFSLQLLHQNIEFTVCGFFPINFSFIYSIIGTITTYVVILIQFQASLMESNER
ncbi:hypothetical protein L9F63_010386, partial [Diploptera punctata]